MVRPRLITIPISHYCEKARWALDYAGVAYSEERHLQLFHFWPALRAARTDSVPVLVTSKGVLDDSSKILQWADKVAPPERKLFPIEMRARREVETLEDDFDEGLGVAGRLWMYTYMLEQVPLILKYSRMHGVPRYQTSLFPAMFPLAKGLIHRIVKTMPTSRVDSQALLDRAFDRIADTLSDGREFLVGERFSAADLTFAALSAAVLIPERYGVALPKLSEIPEEMANQVEKWRKHPAGQFALRMYQGYRR